MKMNVGRPGLKKTNTQRTQTTRSTTRSRASQPAPPTRLTQGTQITTYAELQDKAIKFAQGKLDPILLIGRPGVGKSHTWQDALKEEVGILKHGETEVPQYGWINNVATAWGLYNELYRHRDEPFVIDDVHGLQNSSQAVSLLKAATGKLKPRKVSWVTDKTKKPGAPPSEFETTSPITIIANAWTTTNENVFALEDRALCYEFEPTAQEIHRYVATWFDDQETLDWVGKRLQFIPNLSIRHYEKVSVLRQAGLRGWEDDAELQDGVDPLFQVLLKVLQDEALANSKERLKAWEDMTGLKKTRYYDLKKILDINLGSGFNGARRVKLKSAQ